MNRAQRRAAERQPNLLAAGAAPQAVIQNTQALTAAVGSISLPSDPSPVSEAQLAANRANAQLSTGARTQAGRAIASLNAVKTGLTGRTVLLPTDDVAIYQQHITRLFNKYSPGSDDEKALVQSIADTEWRLLRIAPLEAGYYARGRQKLGDQFAHIADPENREALLQTEIFDLYRKELNNLALQERRLRNHRKDDIAEFEALRTERERQKRANAEIRHHAACSAQKILKNAAKMEMSVNLADFGFEFSECELAAYWQRNEIHRRLTESILPLDFDTFLRQYRAAEAKEVAAA